MLTCGVYLHRCLCLHAGTCRREGATLKTPPNSVGEGRRYKCMRRRVRRVYVSVCVCAEGGGKGLRERERESERDARFSTADSSR